MINLIRWLSESLAQLLRVTEHLSQILTKTWQTCLCILPNVHFLLALEKFLGYHKKKKRQALAFHIDDFFRNLPNYNEQHLSCPSAIYLSSLHYKIRSFSSIQVCEISVKVASGIYIEFSGMPFLSTYSKESTGQTSTKIGSFRGKQLHIANKIGNVQSLLVS